MKNVNTVVGRPYAVTTSAECTITTPEGVIIASCAPGKQLVFVAPCDQVQVSDDDALLTETFSAAALAVSGGGVDEEFVEQKAAAVALVAAEARAVADEATRQALALAPHQQDATAHLQPGERERWNRASILPVGTLLASLCSTMEGYLLCDGQAVSRADYPALFAAIGESFGAGDGESSFNLPDLRGRTLWGASEEQPPGSMLEAGLPDIVGNIGNVGGVYNGAFAYVGQAGGVNGQAFPMANVQFAASRYNPIYGNSDTVQPPAIAVNYFIKH